jgi:hypothetical protein
MHNALAQCQRHHTLHSKCRIAKALKQSWSFNINIPHRYAAVSPAAHHSALVVKRCVALDFLKLKHGRFRASACDLTEPLRRRPAIRP